MALKTIRFRRSFLEFIWQLGMPVKLESNQVKGWYGEWLAYRFLKKKSYQILEKNWRSPYNQNREIDLIALDMECLVFVEVRARSLQAINHGFYSIGSQKKKVLLVACRDFLRRQHGKFISYRFDVVEVDLSQTGGEVFHHENVSLFP